MNTVQPLRVEVKAGDVVIAVSEDPNYCLAVLSAIVGGEAPRRLGRSEPEPVREAAQAMRRETTGRGVDGFANELGVTVEEVQGACSPAQTRPLISLDRHAWEAFLGNTPRRGPAAISGVALAATLLVLWRPHSGVDEISLEDVTAVLHTLDVPANNLSRSVRNCEWLQLRGTKIQLNASKTSKAVAVARAYIQETPIERD